MFLQNICNNIQDFMVSQPRRPQSELDWIQVWHHDGAFALLLFCCHSHISSSHQSTVKGRIKILTVLFNLSNLNKNGHGFTPLYIRL
jgi:hypothetical protein